MSAGFPPGVKSYGHSLRSASATERVAGTDPVYGVYIDRTCGRRCGAPVEFVATYRLDDTARGSHLFRRFTCRRHAERFARRYTLTLPPPLPSDQTLLPFYAEKGEADNVDSHLPL